MLDFVNIVFVQKNFYIRFKLCIGRMNVENLIEVSDSHVAPKSDTILFDESLESCFVLFQLIFLSFHNIFKEVIWC